MASLRQSVGIDLRRESVPDATTLLKFRHLLEKHCLNEPLFATVGRVLQGSGMILKTGTIVDASLIVALSSTKNAEKKRDPEMHQTRKGKQWYFGMKRHLGVDSQSSLAYGEIDAVKRARTAISQKSEPESNTSLVSSNGCGDLRKCATVD
jgi:IS5 family transposase